MIGVTKYLEFKPGVAQPVPEIGPVQTYVIVLAECFRSSRGARDCGIFESRGQRELDGVLQDGPATWSEYTAKLHEGCAVVLDVFENVRTEYEIKSVRRERNLLDIEDVGYPWSAADVAGGVAREVLQMAVEAAFRRQVQYARPLLDDVVVAQVQEKDPMAGQRRAPWTPPVLAAAMRRERTEPPIAAWALHSGASTREGLRIGDERACRTTERRR